MNPSPELYMEYYSDYEFQDRREENYDHIGDIEELVILQIAVFSYFLLCFVFDLFCLYEYV